MDFLNEIFDSTDIVFAEDLFNGVVRLDGDSLFVDLAVTSLEDESPDDFAGRIAIGDEGFNSPEHIDGGLVDSDEDSVVELSQSKQSHDSDDFRVQLVDTSDPDHESQSGFGRYVNLSSEFGLYHLKCTFLRASISARLAFW